MFLVVSGARKLPSVARAAAALHPSAAVQLWRSLARTPVAAFTIHARSNVWMQEWDSISFPVQQHTFRFQRAQKGSIDGLYAAASEVQTLTYILLPAARKKYALEFEPMGRLAAETFEALLTMLVLTNGGQQMLADSVDLESLPAAMEECGLSFHK